MNNRISKTVSIVCVASMVLAGCSAPSFDAETINKIQHIGENVTVISSNIEEQSEKVAESIEKATETAAELTETVNEINEVIAEEEVTEITTEEVALAEDEAIELADLDDDLADRRAGHVFAATRRMRAGFREENREFARTERQRLDRHIVEADVPLRAELARRRRIEAPDPDRLLAGQRQLDVEVLAMDFGTTRAPRLERRLLNHRIDILAVKFVASVRQTHQVLALQELNRLREVLPELRIRADVHQRINHIDSIFTLHCLASSYEHGPQCRTNRLTHAVPP